MKWKPLALAACLLLFASVCSLIYLYLNERALGGLFRSSASVVREVDKLNQLVTVKYTVQRVVGITEPREPLGEESILIMVEGQALAGVNLGGLRESDIQWTTPHSVVIHLPDPSLLNVFLNEKQTRVWDRHITWWTPWVPYDPDLEHKARLKALEDIKIAALQMGILTEARRNAETAVVQLLQALGLEAHVAGT